MRAPRLKQRCYRVLPGRHEAEIAAADDNYAASNRERWGPQPQEKARRLTKPTVGFFTFPRMFKS
jgi:hypothetical protein